MEQSLGDSTDADRYADQNMLAYAYKLKSDAVQSTDTMASANYLAKAAYYSPQIQKEKAYASFYDRAFLDSKESYRVEFAERLIKQGNSKEGMRMLSQQLNTDPTILGELQQAFAQNYTHLDFYEFFNNMVVKSWKTAPGFSLRSPDGKTVHRLEDYRGKWLLIDFWGTWCGPCREEMDGIDAFVKKIKDRKDLAFLSIACRDRPEPVVQYLDSRHYQIPVVMSDNNVEKMYEVTGYPGKFLISPSGNVLPIAFGQDWQKAVEQMAGLRPTKKYESKLLKQKVN
ncbi:MAG TPA: TlpA disulfide reductase family protein [Puia sp.]|nr:TlpA disulfide reductase family protein [Puia sp.]